VSAATMSNAKKSSLSFLLTFSVVNADKQ